MVGQDGTVYASTDYGQSWFGATGDGDNGSYIGADIYLNFVEIFENGTVLVGGRYSEAAESSMYISQDGGLHWEPSYYSQVEMGVALYTWSVDDAAVIDGCTAITVGSQGVIHRTDDCGQSWSSQIPELTDHYSDVDCFDQVCAAVARGGDLVTSDDAGLTWEVMEESVPESGPYMMNINLIDSNVAVVVSTDYAYWVDLNVETWSVMENPDSEYGLSWQDADFYDDEHGVIVGTNLDAAADYSRTFMTEDGGETWSALNVYALEDGVRMYDVDYNGSDALYGFGRSDYYNSSTYGGFYKYIFEEFTLAKLPCGEDDTDINHPCKSVYYVGDDGYRHAFSDEKVYFSWFDDFSDVIIVDEDYLANLPLGDSVTYRPGKQMVKFPSLPTVYAVAGGSELREIASEDIAESLYGEDWNQQVDDISEAFYSHYSFGEVIDEVSDYDPEEEMANAETISDVMSW